MKTATCTSGFQNWILGRGKSTVNFRFGGSRVQGFGFRVLGGLVSVMVWQNACTSPPWTCRNRRKRRWLPSCAIRSAPSWVFVRSTRSLMSRCSASLGLTLSTPIQTAAKTIKPFSRARHSYATPASQCPKVKAFQNPAL